VANDGTAGDGFRSWTLVQLVRRNPFHSVVGPLFFADAVIAVLGSVLGWFVHEKQLTGWGVFHFVCWSLVPPLWFFFEYHLVPPTEVDRRKQIKDSQDVAGKIWAAVVAIMVFVIPRQLG
jgi:hypothetical protein